MDIESAARAEHLAEQGRDDAEAVWRAAWWQTTLALAEPPDSDRKAVTAAYDTAVRILGQSRSWLADRRMTGKALKDLRLEAKITLPPRQAIEYVRAKGDPAQAVATLQDAEERELSLRDFAAELGTQPKSWLREDEQDQRPISPETIREHLADPDKAREVFNAPEPDDPAAAKARMHAGNAINDHDRRLRDHLDDKRHREHVNRGSTNSEAIPEVAAMMATLTEVVVRGGQLSRRLAGGATLSPRIKSALAGDAAKARATIEWLEGLPGEQAADTVEDVLRQWAGGEQS